MKTKEWDAFISHSSEDKATVARPLAAALRRAGARVWLDEHELTVGDSLTEKIDEGLAHSHFGVVILSPTFFAKHWPKRELAGLRAREEEGQKVILPVWHNIDQSAISQFSPIMADVLAANTAQGIDNVAKALIRVIFTATEYDESTAHRSPHRRLAADRTPAGGPERSRQAPASDAALLHVGAPAGGTSFPALPLQAGASPVVPAADARDRKMLIARLRFLGKLKPRFLWHTGDDSCDKAAVDAYLETMRTLAVRDMAALQAFIAATPRVFPASPGGGYVSAGVSNYFACIDRAMREYVQETGPYARRLPAPSVQFRSQRLEAARSKFLSQIKARLPDAGDQAGYGRPAVDRFLSDLRELAVGDIVRLLAFRATAPGFPVVAQGGYFIASVDNFMTRFRRAVNEYITVVSETI